MMILVRDESIRRGLNSVTGLKFYTGLKIQQSKPFKPLPQRDRDVRALIGLPTQRVLQQRPRFIASFFFKCLKK